MADSLELVGDSSVELSHSFDKFAVERNLEQVAIDKIVVVDIPRVDKKHLALVLEDSQILDKAVDPQVDQDSPVVAWALLPASKDTSTAVVACLALAFEDTSAELVDNQHQMEHRPEVDNLAAGLDTPAVVLDSHQHRMEVDFEVDSLSRTVEVHLDTDFLAEIEILQYFQLKFDLHLMKFAVKLTFGYIF